MITTSDFEVVDFALIKHEKIRLRPMYYELGFSNTPTIYGRKAILNRLLHALSFMPNHYGFLIWDIYRPREVQGRLFEWMRDEIKKNQPALSNDENYAEAKKYMSPPSKVGEIYCPPHLSGGAIDLTLFECSSGKEINMGTKFDDCTERAHRDYFESASCLSPNEENIRTNRNILRHAMESAGFTTYKYEWWHYDFGDSFWGNETGQNAIFGPLFGDFEWPKNFNKSNV